MRTALKGWACWHLDAVGAVICVVATLAVYLGGAKPLMRNHEHLVAQQEQLRTQQRHVARLEDALTALREHLQTVRRALDDSTLRLKPLSSLNQHVAEISALATRNDLRIDDIQTGVAQTGTHYEAVPVHLAGSGTYRTCTTFLNRLRQTLPDTSVSSFSLTTTAGGSAGLGMFRIDLQWHAKLSPTAGAAKVQSEGIVAAGNLP
jgi:Tfp pilus assembly protein PilO